MADNSIGNFEFVALQGTWQPPKLFKRSITREYVDGVQTIQGGTFGSQFTLTSVVDVEDLEAGHNKLKEYRDAKTGDTLPVTISGVASDTIDNPFTVDVLDVDLTELTETTTISGGLNDGGAVLDLPMGADRCGSTGSRGGVTMADLTVTAANVLATSTAAKTTGTAGEAITQGETLYKKAADSKLYLADADLSSTAATTVGIALNAAAAGQPVEYCTRGGVNVGTTLTVGETYVQSDTAGGIKPIGDLGSGDYVTHLGVASTTSNLVLNINATGVAVP